LKKIYLISEYFFFQKSEYQSIYIFHADIYTLSMFQILKINHEFNFNKKK